MHQFTRLQFLLLTSKLLALSIVAMVSAIPQAAAIAPRQRPQSLAQAELESSPTPAPNLGANQTEVRSLLQQAEAAYSQRTWEQAEALLKQALNQTSEPQLRTTIQLNRTSVRLERMREAEAQGQEEQAVGWLKQAQQLYQQIIEAKPTLIPAPVPLAIAEALAARAQQDEALRILSTINPQTVASYTLQGKILSDQGRLAPASDQEQLISAKKSFDAAKALNPTGLEAARLDFELAQLDSHDLLRKTSNELFGSQPATQSTLARVDEILKKFPSLGSELSVAVNLAQLNLLNWILPQLHGYLLKEPDDVQKLSDRTDYFNQQRLEVISWLTTELQKASSDRTGVDHRIQFAKQLLSSAAMYNQGKGLTFLPSTLQSQIKQQVLDSEQQAAIQLQMAIRQARTLSHPIGESEALTLLATIANRQGETKTAQDLAQRGLALGGNIPEIAYRLQWQIGRSLKQQKQFNEACSTYQTTVNSVQSLRKNLVAVNQDVQYSFRDNVLPIYREAIETCLEADGEKPSDQRLKQVRQLLEDLQLAELDNFFKEACIEGRSAQIDSIIDRSGSKAAAIYAIATTDRLHILLKLPNQSNLKHHTKKVSQRELEGLAQNFRALVKGSTEGSNDLKIISETSPAHKLYLLLLKNLETDLEEANIETLAFVLDNSLRNIPLAALVVDPKSPQPFLIQQKYAISINPGLQLAFAHQANPTNFNKVLGGGLKSLPLTPALSPLDLTPQELDTVHRIIFGISSPEPSSKPSTKENNATLIDQDFTEENLRQHLEKTYFPILHLSTHANFSPDAEKTVIYVMETTEPKQGQEPKNLNSTPQPEPIPQIKQEKKSPELKTLNAKQFSDLLQRSMQTHNRPIEVLFMSACETSSGDSRAVLGLSAIASRAGVRSTLGTLWRLSTVNMTVDADVKNRIEFISTFYRNVKMKNKAQSLKAAQLYAIEKEINISDWAAFVLVGEW